MSMGIYFFKSKIGVCVNFFILKLKKVVGYNKRILFCEILFIDELKDGEFRVNLEF